MTRSENPVKERVFFAYSTHSYYCSKRSGIDAFILASFNGIKNCSHVEKIISSASSLSVYKLHAFFINNAFFSTQPHCCLTSLLLELQMLRRCCLIHISIIILRHFLYLLYLWPHIYLGLFMLYLCDLFFIFIFTFIMINRIIS